MEKYSGSHTTSRKSSLPHNRREEEFTGKNVDQTVFMNNGLGKISTFCMMNYSRIRLRDTTQNKKAER